MNSGGGIKNELLVEKEGQKSTRFEKYRSKEGSDATQLHCWDCCCSRPAALATTPTRHDDDGGDGPYGMDDINDGSGVP